MPMLRWKDLETTVGTSPMDLVQEIQAWELRTHRKVRCKGCVCLMGGGVKNILWSCYPDANRWLLLYHRLQVIVILIYTTSILIRNRRAKQKHIMGLKQSSTSTLNPCMSNVEVHAPMTEVIWHHLPSRLHFSHPRIHAQELLHHFP